MSLLRYIRLSARSVRAYAVYLVGGEAGGGGTNFSTTETDTGLTWTDGSPVYQKVVAIAAGPNNSTVNVAHGIAGLGTMIDIRGTIFASGAGLGRTLQTPDTTASNSMRLAYDATNIILASGGNYAVYAGHAVLLYTKA